ncbi:MAG: precorrin-8X methylmutase [SAR324 cluster bacterium]|nr:precorrin-8X methylmutase [SAR324 cluster bacterium]
MTLETDTSYGIVIAGHGSRDKEGVQEFEDTIALLKKQHPHKVVTHGFLEFASPTIDYAIRENIKMGSKRIVMIPAILFAASHGKNDMPIEMLSTKKEFPDVDFQYAGAMELHPLLLKLFQERIIEAEARSSRTIKRSESLLVIVGRGTTDSDTNSNVSKLTRMIEEGMGFGASFVCYSGTAEPMVRNGIEFAAKMGFKRLVVIPYFLFTGVLIKRIYQAADEVSELFPDLEILKAQYLGVHENVTNVWMEKAEEGINGKAVMNCTLCKYRTQIVGFEKEVGTVQEAHHLHVRGLNENNESQEHHHHDHSHGHHHHHASDEVEKQKAEIYVPHPIEAESFKIIEEQYDWLKIPESHRPVIQRLVHTSGDFSIVEDISISKDAVESGVRALISGSGIITDVTMVKSGLKRALLSQIGTEVVCEVHEEETRLLAKAATITRSAAGIRRAWQKRGDDVIVAIGDAPTAVMETIRLIKEQNWRPHLIIGLPVGFVGTQECKEQLRQIEEVPVITNSGNRGGSPWAAAVVNALMIRAVNHLAVS